MTINYDWYTTNYWHAAVFATLIVKATHPSPSIGLKKSVDYFLKFVFSSN